MNPNVTVLLPAYKVTFLQDAIESLLSQTYENFNLVILDDASPYDVKSIVDSFHSTKITYFRNSHNIGGTDLVANWNKAFSYATGELVVLASDDDLYHPDFLSTLVKLSEKYPHIDLFHCRVCVINESGEPIFWAPSISEYESDIDFIYQRSINRRTQLIPDFMFRRDALKAIGGFVNYPKAWYADEMSVYLLAKGKGVVCAQETLFFWRTSDQNISSLSNDTMQKAEASVIHIKNMESLLSKLNAKNEKDRFLLKVLKTKYRNRITQQLIYDMAKSKMVMSFKIMHKWPNLLGSKDKVIFLIKKMRLLFHI